MSLAMAALCVVKPSPGRGDGVFATRYIAPETEILSERPAYVIHKPAPSTTPADVHRVYEKLSTKQKQRFMNLHEGRRPYESKIFRIHKANAFGNGEESYVCMKNIQAQSLLRGKGQA